MTSEFGAWPWRYSSLQLCSCLIGYEQRALPRAHDHSTSLLSSQLKLTLLSAQPMMRIRMLSPTDMQLGHVHEGCIISNPVECGRIPRCPRASLPLFTLSLFVRTYAGKIKIKRLCQISGQAPIKAGKRPQLRIVTLAMEPSAQALYQRAKAAFDAADIDSSGGDLRMPPESNAWFENRISQPQRADDPCWRFSLRYVYRFRLSASRSSGLLDVTSPGVSQYLRDPDCPFVAVGGALHIILQLTSIPFPDTHKCRFFEV